jgi:hypothetical protein
MLFYSLTWQQFLVAALILSSIWYLLFMPLLYRRQLKDWISRTKANQQHDLTPNLWKKDWQGELADEEQNLIGKSQMPEGISRVSMEHFSFNNDTESDLNRERQQALIPDLMEELKNILNVVNEEQGNKNDFIALFDIVRSKYGGISGSASEKTLNEFIQSRLPFPISNEELTRLWLAT